MKMCGKIVLESRRDPVCELVLVWTVHIHAYALKQCSKHCHIPDCCTDSAALNALILHMRVNIISTFK